MSGIEWFSSPTWQRVGLALLHFLWQGAAVALAMGGMIHLLRLRHGLGRHGLYLAGLVSMAACPIATFLIARGGGDRLGARAGGRLQRWPAVG